MSENLFFLPKSLEFLRCHSQAHESTGKPVTEKFPIYRVLVAVCWLLAVVFLIWLGSGYSPENVSGAGIITGDDGSSGAVVLIPANSANELCNGMCGVFFPDCVDPGKYGGIRCVVRKIYPEKVVLPEATVTFSDPVIRELFQRRSGWCKVEVLFIPEEDSVSGVAWTKDAGNSRKLTTGGSGKVFIDYGGVLL